MSDPILIMTWLWAQTPDRHGFDVAKVNRWAAQLRPNLTIPHQLACVTHTPQGLDPDIRVIEPPGFFEGLRINTWKEQVRAPQCYRRLALFHPDAARIFGSEWIAQMDIDMLAIQSLDPLFSRRDVLFRALKGTTERWPYNGSLVMLRAGSRPKVWERFAAAPESVATAARKQFVGSDQAVMAFLLGHGERTFDEADGVYCHSSRILKNKNMNRPLPNMRLMFFPGEAKPWNDGVKQQWMRDAWLGSRPPLSGSGAVVRAPVPRIKIRAYRDGKGWGTEIAKAAAKRGLFCTMFGRPSMVQQGIAFIRLDQQGSQRAVSKGIVEELGRRGVPTMPTRREGRWYDDKGAQLEALGQWLPRTIHTTSRSAAEAAIAGLGLPFVSKSVDGSSSKGVRLINTESEAARELDRVFTGDGIPSVYDRRQRGYVYWQEFVRNNQCDYRVCVVGGFVYGLVRNNRPGDFRASGSGDNFPMTLQDERERGAAALAVEIADAIGTDWMAFDIVFSEDRALVLEMSSAWTMAAYTKCHLFKRDATLARTRRAATDSWDVAIDVMRGLWVKHTAEQRGDFSHLERAHG